MIGCDLIRISRISEAVKRGGIKFIQRFTQNPDLPLELVNQTSRVAGMWTAKEAAFKALSAKGITWSQIRVEYARDRPEIRVLGADDFQVDVSISHDGDYAFGVAAVRRGKC